MRDGGGILPDSILAVDSVPAMVYDLYNSDAFFNYANHFVATHPTIGAPTDFLLTDEDYAAFVDAIASSDFTYNARSVAALSQARQVARIEGRYDDVKDDFDRLESKLRTNDLRWDLERFRSHIQQYLETELVSRYYYQRGALQHQAQNDKAIRKAVETLR